MLQQTTLQQSFYQQNQDATTNKHATTNVEECYWPMQHTRAHDVSGLSALIRAPVIVFVTVRNVQLSV
jgi:hypothetical protein